MDSEKQTEGFRGEGVVKRDRLLMGSGVGTYCMVHGCYTQLMNQRTLHKKTGIYCMLTSRI